MFVRRFYPAAWLAGVILLCGCASEEMKPTPAVSNIQRVTFREAIERQPNVSPDGRKLAFAAKLRTGGANAPFNVWVLDTVDQRKLVQVTQHTADSLRPSWAADQKTVLFDSKRLRTRTIWEKSATGLGAEQQITADGKTNDWDAHVSPDGKIAFISEPEGLGYTLAKIFTFGLYDGRKAVICDSDGTRLTKIHAASVNWSPDGEQVVFSSNWGCVLNNYDIWVMKADGSKRQKLTSHPANDIDPSWSPDGSKIVFSSDRAKRPFWGGDEFDLWVMNADGSGLTQLTWGGRHEGHPSWGADGYIYYQTNSSAITRDNWDIWRLKPILGRIIPRGLAGAEGVTKDLKEEIRELEFDLQKKDTGPLRNIKPITEK
jgi:Tol biopolymer transport system component